MSNNISRIPVRVLISLITLCIAVTTHAQILYVDDDAPTGGDGQSWPTAYNDLQDALETANQSTSSIEIRIAGGTYRLISMYDSFEIIAGMTLAGGYAGVTNPDPAIRDIVAHPTILSGDIEGNDIADLPEGVYCYSGWGDAYENGCERFDLDGDGDVDVDDLGNYDNSLRVIEVINVSGLVTLDGLTITGGVGGYPDGPGVYVNQSEVHLIDCRIQGNLTNIGGGIFALDTNLTATRCTFHGNKAEWEYGGGLFIDGEEPVSLVDCKFYHNSADSGGGICAQVTQLHMVGCDFIENYGSGCQAAGATADVADCSFTRNVDSFVGGGLICGDASSITRCRFIGNVANASAGGLRIGDRSSVSDSIFLGNVAGHGTAMQGSGSVTVTNCVFSGNHSTNIPGTIYITGDSDTGTDVSTITNCTVVNNTSDIEGPYSGIGAVAFFSSLHVKNSIFRNNRDSEDGQVAATGILSITNSCIEGLHHHAGFGNIDADPLFNKPAGEDGIVGTADDDLRLSLLSPCTDAGDNEADVDSMQEGSQPLPMVDLDGDPRFADSVIPDTGNAGTTGLPVVDMGAYEYQYNGDCNGNGVMDEQDVAQGTSPDCNTNGYPDECELASNDCNNSGIPDQCELDGNDCDMNNIIDACELADNDCNSNSIHDACELTDNDCNLNSVPDECDLADNDCNGDSIPDDCELEGNDCNNTEIPDDCELVDNDCNANGMPDECEYDTLILPAGQPSDQMVCSNGTAIFTVSDQGVSSTYQWYKGDHSNPMTDITGKINGAQDATLYIHDALDSDEGFYFCEVTDGCIIRDSDKAELGIILRPLIRNNTAGATTCEGGTVILTVTHDGWPSLSYRYIWRKDGMALANQPRSNTLSISSADIDDDGIYTCEIANTQCGMSELSPEMDVQVIGARFLEQPATQCHQSGETAVFDMAVEYEKPISGYVWQRWYDSPYNRWINVAAPAAGDVQPLEVSASADALYRGGVYLDNACWSYSNPATLYVGDATGDLDGDGDIDLMDMAKFTECFGLDSDTEPRCTCADFDWADTVINLSDWSQMEAEITGPGDTE